MSLATRSASCESVDFDQRGDRPEDFFLRDRHAVVDLGEQRRVDVEARPVRHVAAKLELRALFAAFGDVTQHPFVLLLRHQRSHVRLGIERVTGNVRLLPALDEARREFRAMRLSTSRREPALQTSPITPKMPLMA